MEELISSGKSNTVSAQDQPVQSDQGDVFSDNVNAADGTHPRRFFTVIADTDAASKRWSDRSIRPALALTNPDGISNLGGTAVTVVVSDLR